MEASLDEEVIIQKEARRMIRETAKVWLAARNSASFILAIKKIFFKVIPEHKVEAKGEDETMKDFKRRIRNETRKV